jgi:hypothetical protein
MCGGGNRLPMALAAEPPAYFDTDSRRGCMMNNRLSRGGTPVDQAAAAAMPIASFTSSTCHGSDWQLKNGRLDGVRLRSSFPEPRNFPLAAASLPACYALFYVIAAGFTRGFTAYVRLLVPAADHSGPLRYAPRWSRLVSDASLRARQLAGARSRGLCRCW